LTAGPSSAAAHDTSPLARRPVGLYDPRFEREECGIGFVAHVDGRPRREMVELGLEGLRGVEHRGAVAADSKSGDGAGLLIQIPRVFFAGEALRLGAEHADPDRLGVAFLFLDAREGEEGERARDAALAHVRDALAAEQLTPLAWREVPVDPDAIGEIAVRAMPRLTQVIFEHVDDLDADDAERAAFRARRRARISCHGAGLRYYAASWSFRTVTYKALCAAPDLGAFYTDLADPRFESSFAIFHSRYSTNTAPTWERAQPYRMLCHNGEINTIEGNANLMRARESDLGADWIAPEVARPVIESDQSDSAKLDNALELLVRGGRDIRHSLAMLVPAVWEGQRATDPDVRDFYRYHSCLVEPWDGPAGLIFTDGHRVGASLDRNGLRPLRYLVCEDGTVIASSEVGAIRTEGRGTVRRERLGPGQMVCVDPARGGLQEDVEIKHRLAHAEPYGDWLRAELRSAEIGQPVDVVPPDVERRQLAYGYTKEELTSVLRPMATEAKEPTSSMGEDTPMPPVALWRRPISHHLKQRFAQVTNPPIDHLRENEVMSLRTLLGPRAPILSSGPHAATLIELESFVLYPEGLQRLVLDPDIPFDVAAVDATFAVTEGPEGLVRGLRRLGDEATDAVRGGAGILVVSDGGANEERCRIPILLAVGAVHQRLLDEELRTGVSLVAEADEARETHDMACLLGFGADAIVPRLAFETFAHLADEGLIRGDDLSGLDAQERLRAALEDGVLKIMSKMGISTVDAYRSAQIFEAIGLGHDVIDLCLTGTVSRLGGLTLTDIAEDVLAQHATAFPPQGQADADGETGDETDPEIDDPDRVELPSPGVIKFSRRGAEYHDINPDVVGALHEALGLGKRATTEPFRIDSASSHAHTADERAAHLLLKATAEGRFDLYRRFSSLVDERPVLAPRDLLEFRTEGEPIPLEEVEPVAAIARRFSTGAMSHGALSAEAHETLAKALNMIGGAANSGEGGEDPARYRTRGTDRDANCKVKQIASGRFGVTPEYCAFADELQIKMAQGSKPGEGGQIPGHKVSEEIARLRHTTPGVTLISPPPHHDIYSIEDLAQLIYDLKQVNPSAAVSVKLVAETGVGQIAAGVVKGLADVVQISGHDGGTGASPLSSIQHAGMPWELGLAETQQTLRLNGLRGRVRLRADGGLKNGRDVLIAALLGADEYSFGTAALLAEGCILVRTCHRNTCPVGIATQRRDLRDRFEGRPEQVAAYLLFVAEEVRERLAELGLRSLDEAVGRVDLLAPRAVQGRAARLDPSGLLADLGDEPRRFTGSIEIQRPRSPLGDLVFDDALETVFLGGLVEYRYYIRNAQRTVGARVGGAVGLEFGTRVPHGTARLRFAGEAGQSFGAFLTDGLELVLTGEANDYVGKGMGGGVIVVRPPEDDAGDPVLVGNTVLYGATGGELFVAGRAGERFAVRNSGATAVVEGTGDHACEYMTNGTVVILGPTGSNLGAGMSGGQAFVYDPTAQVLAKVNRQLVEARRPDGYELDQIRELVARHATLTGSERSRELLDDWDLVAEHFWRVAPKTALEKVGASDAGGARTTS
jgi:glutamate synthase domain-containing protein 2/glutamate synthase domain-containing protein 1/glutamate synthase domain-containing protein 3